MSNIDKQALRERYSPKPVPKCHICGEEMTIQRMSASRITYGCTGATYDDKGCHYAEGRSIADDHYEQSRVTVVDVSDPDVLALLDENLQLQREKDATEAVALALRDDMRQAREQLEEAEKQIVELSRAASVNSQWKPDVCPVTGRKFFMWIEHETLGYVPTYGGPFDSYTIPTRDSSGEFSCERYDHDLGGWVGGEFIGLYLIDDDEQCRVCELEERIAELEKGHQEAAKQINSWRRLAKQNIAERGKDISELEAARQRIAELENSETQLINERDAAESALADMYQAATGERPEWSNMFGFADAVDVVEERLATLEANQSQTTPTGIQLITEAIGAHGYIVGCLLQGRPDLALEESRKWVSAFGQAAEIVSAQDAAGIKVKG
ncbi:hypothetical protein UJ25_000919 [Salmonella enterica subsp. enterica serovar Thompson]|nr:hypothetical protein [Salmonella enterica subsp. enterica serovar Thompson]